MVLPAIPLALIGIGAVSGASGAVLTLKGGYDIKRANGRIRRAGELYEQERAELQLHADATNQLLADLGVRQEHAIQVVVERMIDFLRRNEKRVAEGERLLIDGLEQAGRQVELSPSLGQDALSWMRGIVGSAATGVGINSGLTTAVMTLGTASTGTSISTLSGAAATNATLAAIGGGSLASGGGGMAAGALALNFVTIGPAVLVTGLFVAGQGSKAITKARENEATVNVAIADIQKQHVEFDAIEERARELEAILESLVARASSALDLLETEPFDPALHAVPFQLALATTTAVRDIVSTPVVDDLGNLNDDTARFTLKYRSLIKETTS